MNSPPLVKFYKWVSFACCFIDIQPRCCLEPEPKIQNTARGSRGVAPGCRVTSLAFAADSCSSSTTCKEKQLQQLINYHSRRKESSTEKKDPSPVWSLWSDSCFSFYGGAATPVLAADLYDGKLVL